MEKNNLVVLGIVGLIILLAIFYNYKLTQNFMSVRYYDENKQLIRNPFSTVDGVPNITFIGIDIKVTNSGNAVLNCEMIELQPQILNNSMVRSTKLIPISTYSSWSSGLMNISNLTGNINFNATVKCNYNDGNQVIYLDNKTGGVNVNIQ